MPEGDTLFRTARALAPALVGKTVTRFVSPVPALARAKIEGRTIAAVDARGKNLLIRFDDGKVLHTHLRMNGAWHLYRPGERWRKPDWQARIVIEVAGAVAVCFLAPIIRLLRGESGDPLLTRLGPDILGRSFGVAEARARLRTLGDEAIGDAIVHQGALAGIGNIYKSEALFAARVSPFANVKDLSDEALDAVISAAKRMMQASASGQMSQRTRTGRARFFVYRRVGKPCIECGAFVQSMRQKNGRVTYFCARCQGVTR